jgi:hypothetical protein
MKVEPLEAMLLERFGVTREAALRFGAWLSAMEVPELPYEAVLAIADVADALEAEPVAHLATDADIVALRDRYLEALLVLVFVGPLHHRLHEQLERLAKTPPD